MKKPRLILFALLFSSNYFCFSQDSRITTFDFVQILNDNTEEALFYYENNWLVLRERAVQLKFIASYEWVKVESSTEAPFVLILMTTYSGKKQYDAREVNFQKLIEEKGPIKLLNEEQPASFRKVIFSKEEVAYLPKGSQ